MAFQSAVLGALAASDALGGIDGLVNGFAGSLRDGRTAKVEHTPHAVQASVTT